MRFPQVLTARGRGRRTRARGPADARRADVRRPSKGAFLDVGGTSLEAPPGTTLLPARGYGGVDGLGGFRVRAFGRLVPAGRQCAYSAKGVEHAGEDAVGGGEVLDADLATDVV